MYHVSVRCAPQVIGAGRVDSGEMAGERVDAAMDVELKRDARAVIERITQLRDSL